MVREVGPFEFEVLNALTLRRRDAYGLTIRDEIKEQTQRDVSVGAIYTALERLEGKGFVASKWGEPTQERGGRRKRLYEITGAGSLAADRFRAKYSRFGLVPAGGLVT